MGVIRSLPPLRSFFMCKQALFEKMKEDDAENERKFEEKNQPLS